MCHVLVRVSYSKLGAQRNPVAFTMIYAALIPREKQHRATLFGYRFNQPIYNRNVANARYIRVLFRSIDE